MSLPQELLAGIFLGLHQLFLNTESLLDKRERPIFGEPSLTFLEFVSS
jgi:hypothetical protein